MLAYNAPQLKRGFLFLYKTASQEIAIVGTLVYRGSGYYCDYSSNRGRCQEVV